jgi:hypothetical protein
MHGCAVMLIMNTSNSLHTIMIYQIMNTKPVSNKNLCNNGSTKCQATDGGNEVEDGHTLMLLLFSDMCFPTEVSILWHSKLSLLLSRNKWIAAMKTDLEISNNSQICLKSEFFYLD